MLGLIFPLDLTDCNWRNIFREEARNSVSYDSERSFSYESPSFQSRYSYYDGCKHERDYLYPVTRHGNLSFN